MFVLNLPIDTKQQASIERRRYQEKQRLLRIFNEKYRRIGIDKEALDQQIKEREYLKKLEKQRNDALDRIMICNDFKKAITYQEELVRQRRTAQELNDFRRLYQKPENAKEGHLNDPNQWKYSTPTRISDSQLGPSSAQIFAGEDLQAFARKKVQQEQLRNYFNLQIMNKIKKDEEERLANLFYDCKQLELSEQNKRYEQIQNEYHRASKIAIRNYNEIFVRFQHLLVILNKSYCFSIG